VAPLPGRGIDPAVALQSDFRPTHLQGVDVMRIIAGAVLITALLSSPLLAQSPAAAPSPAPSRATWTGLPDRFQIDTGYFRLDASTLLRYNGPSGGNGEVDFEHDLGLPSTVDTFWLEGSWRITPRQQVKLGFTRFRRDLPAHTLGRDFVWGGSLYSAGLEATTTSGSDILGAYYRFAIVNKERFEIGPTAGVGHLWLTANIRATGTIHLPDGTSQEVTRDAGGSTGSITGALGGYAEAWPLRHWVVRGDYLYIKVKPEHSEASVTDWRIATDYYFYKAVGLGLQYKYNRYRYDRGADVAKLGGSVTYKGVQAFATFRF
jgi:hypothetical protein